MSGPTPSSSSTIGLTQVSKCKVCIKAMGGGGKVDFVDKKRSRSISVALCYLSAAVFFTK